MNESEKLLKDISKDINELGEILKTQTKTLVSSLGNELKLLEEISKCQSQAAKAASTGGTAQSQEKPKEEKAGPTLWGQITASAKSLKEDFLKNQLKRIPDQLVDSFADKTLDALSDFAVDTWKDSDEKGSSSLRDTLSKMGKEYVDSIPQILTDWAEEQLKIVKNWSSKQFKLVLNAGKEKLFAFAKSAWNWLKGVFTQEPFLFDKLFEGASTMFASLKTGAGNFFSGLGSFFSPVTNMFASIGSGITSFLGGFFAANGGILPGHFQPVAAFAGGAPYIDRPTLGWVGEGRYPEAVVPLPDGRSIPVAMRGGRSINVHNQVNVNLSADAGGQGVDNIKAQQIGAAVSQALEQRMRQFLVNEQRPGGLLNQQGVY